MSTRLFKKVNQWQQKIFYWHRRSRLLLPGMCLICMQPLLGERDLCQPCKRLLPANLICCDWCAESLSSDYAKQQLRICQQCAKTPAAFDKVLAPWLYKNPFNKLVWEFKYTKNLAAGYLLVDLLFDALIEHNQTYDCLVVIPGQKKRIQQRGYHAPSWLAKHLSLLTGIPFLKNGLMRVKDIESQQDLNRKARFLNPKGAFKAMPHIAGKKVLLLDDVITTGASAHWAADELKKQGAASVDVLAAAKTAR
ncbi:MAG TPA: hypothetical protein VJY63_00375 [Marinospirillum sp.]|uniref:ComF family protein n=1 Tax=Marinospirillum sp. TaxID=2183934 RepID=UPI002B4A95B6|nr:hypothetical protein [Marinospirillum sp.]HKM14365.1 hypothetical protein [Marinospirillum sp.]